MKRFFVAIMALGLLTGTVSCREKSTIEKVADDVEDAID